MKLFTNYNNVMRFISGLENRLVLSTIEWIPTTSCSGAI